MDDPKEKSSLRLFVCCVYALIAVVVITLRQEAFVGRLRNRQLLVNKGDNSTGFLWNEMSL